MKNPIRIVICDDEQTAISIISASVEALLTSRSVAVEIEKFTSAKECADYFRQHPVDLAFLDLSMPEMDGLELAREIKKTQNPALVFVSSQQERVFETFEVEPFGFVRKDRFMQDITVLLNRYLDMAGVPLSDTETWTKFMNQLTWDELKDLIVYGGYSTLNVDSVGKTKAVDADGPNQWNGTHQWCDEVTSASTYNVTLAEKEGRLMGCYGMFSGATGWYGPGMDTHRSPFSGRNNEYYSQDGVQGGYIAAAVVKGAESKGTICYIKHLAFNDQETCRDGKVQFVWATEQALRENYLKMFQMAAQEGGSSAAMTGYARLGGIPNASNNHLLSGILQDEWGWEGYLVTDGYIGWEDATEIDLMVRAGYSLELYTSPYEDAVMGADGVGDYRYDAAVAYPFGYGLSYTTFAYSDFKVTENEKDFTVQVTVTNTGAVSGKEVVEVYLQKPYTDYDREHCVEKAAVELGGFAKTALLEPNASETVTVTVEKERLKSYDADGYQTYILDAGDYYLTAAANAHAAVNNVLAAKGYSPDNTDGRMAENGDTAMTWKYTVETLDAKTYAVSAQTGSAITNQLNDADVNRYAGSGEKAVTYVSRSDWTGTWPQEAVTLSIATEQMAADIASNKDLPTGGEMPTYGADNGLTLAMLRGLAYDDPQWDKLLDQMSYADQATLVTTGYFTTVALESIGKPATAEDDGPTGVAHTTTGTSFPSEGIWASSWNTELIRQVGDALAEDALASGKTGMYAGGVNIHRTPFDGRSHEYFSEDALLSAIAIQYEVQGMQAKGVVAHVKHLAFNEEETDRNGVSIWLNEQEARELMLLPFEYALSESKGNSGAFMTSFNRAGVIWTGANDGLLIHIVRDEWGFHGYNITDMASGNGAYYMTWQDGVINGTDLFLGEASALTEYKDNAAFAQRLREAAHHILYTVVNQSAAMNGLGVESVVLTVTPWWQSALNISLIVLGVLSLICSALYIVSWAVMKKQDRIQVI